MELCSNLFDTLGKVRVQQRFQPILKHHLSEPVLKMDETNPNQFEDEPSKRALPRANACKGRHKLYSATDAKVCRAEGRYSACASIMHEKLKSRTSKRKKEEKKKTTHR